MSPLILSGFFSMSNFGTFKNANSTRHKTIHPVETPNSTVKLLFINASPIAGAQAVARAVAMPNIPIPSEKRSFGIISEAIVDVEVFENARANP